MAGFKDDDSEWQGLDWRLLQNSAIALYFKSTVLQADVTWFAAHGYRVLAPDVGGVESSTALLVELGELLSSPDCYGKNLDAFNDCLGDVEVPEDGGLVLVLQAFDSFAAAFRSDAQSILDTCAVQSRRFLMTGRRFLVLVQSGDPRISFDPVGACPVMWNPQEWLNSHRGL